MNKKTHLHTQIHTLFHRAKVDVPVAMGLCVIVKF